MNMQTQVHIGLLYFVNEMKYFDSFEVEHISEEIKKFIGNKNIIATFFPVQANNSIIFLHFIH